MYGTPGGIVLILGGDVMYWSLAMGRSFPTMVSAYPGRNSRAYFAAPGIARCGRHSWSKSVDRTSNQTLWRGLLFSARAAARRHYDVRRKGRRLTSRWRE